MSGLRESKKAATRTALARAAAEIVLHDGADALTVPAITAAAGVSPRTFHNYFASREEALIAFISERVDALSTELALLPDELDLTTAMEQVIAHNLRTSDSEINSFPALFRLGEVLETLTPLQTKRAAHSIFDPMITTLRRRNDTLTDFQLTTSVRLISAAVGSALEWHFRTPEPRDPADGERLVHEALSLLRPE